MGVARWQLTREVANFLLPFDLRSKKLFHGSAIVKLVFTIPKANVSTRGSLQVRKNRHKSTNLTFKTDFNCRDDSSYKKSLSKAGAQVQY